MSARTAPNGSACQVVECTKTGWGKPRLCDEHRQEYIQLTDDYHSYHEEAERRYLRVSKLLDDAGWLKPLSGAEAVKKALKVVYGCLDAIDDVIKEREAHHARFFGERE